MSRARSQPRFPAYGWLGLAVMVLTELALLRGSSLAAVWLTPLMWTGLILSLDAVLKRWIGRSWLIDRRREFPFLLLISVLVWLLFEAYNLHLKNWIYEGLPVRDLVRDIGYFWSFATIMPGVLLLSELVDEFLRRVAGDRLEVRVAAGPNWLWFLAGLAMVTIPLALPAHTAAYLFGAVWFGFIFLIDSLNDRLGLPSLRNALRQGRTRPIIAVLVAGLLCGFIWEAWNYQAYLANGAFWIYTFPGALRVTGLQFGQMPLIGLLGFPPFALELLVFYRFLHCMLGGERVFGTLPDYWLGNS